MPANTPQRKPVKFLDAKVMIATLAVAVTIGLWNLFSIDAVRAEKAVPPALQADPPVSTAGQAQDLPPLPTLVPLVTLQELPAAGQAVPAGAVQASPVPVQTGKLRAVAAPTVTIVQKNRPMVDAPVVSSGGGGGGRRPVARSRAS